MPKRIHSSSDMQESTHHAWTICCFGDTLYTWQKQPNRKVFREEARSKLATLSVLDKAGYYTQNILSSFPKQLKQHKQIKATLKEANKSIKHINQKKQDPVHHSTKQVSLAFRGQLFGKLLDISFPIDQTKFCLLVWIKWIHRLRIENLVEKKIEALVSLFGEDSKGHNKGCNPLISCTVSIWESCCINPYKPLQHNRWDEILNYIL